MSIIQDYLNSNKKQRKMQSLKTYSNFKEEIISHWSNVCPIWKI